MDPRIQTMLDHFEIRQMLAEYCHGCDRGDPDLMASGYLEDSWDNHGMASGTGPEFARLITERITRECDVIYHLLGQSLIQVDGDLASAETYFFSIIGDKDETGAATCHQLAGRYVDRLERVQGKWKVRYRVAVRDCSISLTVLRDAMGLNQMVDGSRDASDPGAALLQLARNFAGSADAEVPAVSGARGPAGPTPGPQNAALIGTPRD